MVPSIFLENLCKGKILCDRCFLALGTNEVPHHLEQANWIRVGIVSLYKKKYCGCSWILHSLYIATRCKFAFWGMQTRLLTLYNFVFLPPSYSTHNHITIKATLKWLWCISTSTLFLKKNASKMMWWLVSMIIKGSSLFQHHTHSSNSQEGLHLGWNPCIWRLIIPHYPWHYRNIIHMVK